MARDRPRMRSDSARPDFALLVASHLLPNRNRALIRLALQQPCRLSCWCDGMTRGWQPAFLLRFRVPEESTLHSLAQVVRHR